MYQKLIREFRRPREQGVHKSKSWTGNVQCKDNNPLIVLTLKKLYCFSSLAITRFLLRFYIFQYFDGHVIYQRQI